MCARAHVRWRFALARENLERLLNQLECRLDVGLRAFVAVGVVLRPQAPMRPLYLRRRGSIWQAQSSVVFVKAHACVPSFSCRNKTIPNVRKKGEAAAKIHETESLRNGERVRQKQQIPRLFSIHPYTNPLWHSWKTMHSIHRGAPGASLAVCRQRSGHFVNFLSRRMCPGNLPVGENLAESLQ
jgi:hypothetical protein